MRHHRSGRRPEGDDADAREGRRDAPEPDGPPGNATRGKAIYNTNGCGACHTYTPAGSTGKVGPSLDDLAASAKKANRVRLPVHALVDRRPERLHRPRLPGERDARDLRAEALRARSSPTSSPSSPRAPEPSGGLPAGGRRGRHGPRPHADVGGQRPPAAHARGDPARRGGRAARDRLHRADGAVDQAGAGADRIAGAARLLPGGGGRRRRRDVATALPRRAVARTGDDRRRGRPRAWG